MSEPNAYPGADLLPLAQTPQESPPSRRWIVLLAVALVALIVGAAASTSILLLSGWRKPAEQRYGVAFFLEKEITAAQAATIQTELAKLPAKDLRHESSEEAFARFKETYKSRPALIEDIEKNGSKDSLPASFRLTMSASDFDCGAMAAISKLPGVKQHSVVVEPIAQIPSFAVHCE